VTALSTRPVGPARARRTRTHGRSTSGAPDDILVFELIDGTFQLIGGSGRGSSWAGIVTIPMDRSLVAHAWDLGTPQRQSGARAAQVAGPYHARHAVAVPVGAGHVVVFGASLPIALRDSDLVRMAADAVDRTHGVPADKLLTDELELVHTLRSLMAYRPENVRDTLEHIATIAAGALSCEVALVQVTLQGVLVRATIGLDGDAAEIPDGIDRQIMAATTSGTPIVEQGVDPSESPFGVDVASHITLPIGTDPALGAIALGHSIDRPRGFTSLCQRIGRAVADAAELLITQASAREQLAAERDLLARISGTDPLTGIANRRAWDDATSRYAADEAKGLAYVLSCDLDDLKATNDRFGHATGDALIRAAANLLTSSVRRDDMVARIGGDEFIVLLRDVDPRMARRIHARIRRAERVWRITEHNLTPRLSIGRAEVVGGDIEAAHRAADARMYANKRRRARAFRSPARDRRLPAQRRP
jgi:diguanylate cyclase (GGDEF)-like protein